MPVYADTADLVAMLPDGLAAPEDATRLLTRASRAIDSALRTAVYAVDDDGAPTDTLLAAAVLEATCEQAAWWLETGDEQGVAGAITSAGSGGGPYWSGGVPRLSPAAMDVLRGAVDSSGVALFGYAPWM